MTLREFTGFEVTGVIGFGTERDPHRTLTVYFERLPDGTVTEIAQRDPWDEHQRTIALTEYLAKTPKT